MSTISIEVDIGEVFYEIDDKHLIAEMARRNLEMPASSMEAVQTAIAQIRRGDTLDAITTLEREFWPKWKSVEDSESALRMALRAANDNQEAAPAVSDTGVTA